jgi:hypothetical protein
VTEVVSDWALSILVIVGGLAACIIALALALGLVFWITRTAVDSWLDLKIKARSVELDGRLAKEAGKRSG